MGDYTPGFGPISGSGTLANRPGAGSVPNGYLYFVTSGASSGNVYESDGVATWTLLAAGVGTSPVTSVAGRTGAVVLAVGDVSGAEATANKNAASGYPGLSAGSLINLAQLGTGTPTSSNFLRGDGTWATPSGSSLTVVSGNLAADVVNPGDPTTLMTTGSLAAGTWFLVVSAFLKSVAAASIFDLVVKVGSATATFAGPQGTSGGVTGTITETMFIPFSFTSMVTVTGAGTLIIVSRGGGGGGTWSKLAWTDATIAATGYTAIKVA